MTAIMHRLVTLLRRHRARIFTRWQQEQAEDPEWALPSVSPSYYTRWVLVLFRMIIRQMDRPDSQWLDTFIRRTVDHTLYGRLPIHAVCDGVGGLIALKRIVLDVLIETCHDTPEQLQQMCHVLNTEIDRAGTRIVQLYVTIRERRLYQRERYLESIIASSADAIITLDERLFIQSWNRGAQAIYGYTPEEAIGQHVRTLIPEERLEQGELDRILDVLHERGVIRAYETVRKTKNGGRVDVQFTATRLMDEQERPTGYISVIIRDITGRKKLESSLKRKIEGFSIIHEIGRALQQTIDIDEILYIVLVGVTAGQALKFNRACLFLLDAPGETLEGRMAIGPSSPEEAGRIWSELAEKQLSLGEMLRSHPTGMSMQDSSLNKRVRKMRIPTSDTAHVLVQALTTRSSFNIDDAEHADAVPSEFLDRIGSHAFAVVPLTAQEHPLGVLLVDNHITGRPILDEDIELLEIFAQQAGATIENFHLYQTQTRQVHALEEANRNLKRYQERLIHAERLSAIGQMAATVAHEIRNPLVSIGGFARALLRTMPQDSPHREYLDIIVKEGNRLEKILTELLDLARPVQPQASSVDVNALIRSGLQVIEEDARRRSIRIDTRLQDDLPPLPLDADQIRQVLLNLFRNALEAMPHGGCLTLRTTDVDQDCIEIEVADTGVGIAAEALGHIFEPFFTTKSGGSGLGLAISSRIIRDHEGTMRADSTMGEGATFVLRLPKHRATATAPSECPEEIRAFS